MADVRYFVRLFTHSGGDLVSAALIEAHDAIAAIGEALRRVQEDAAGALVFACTGEEDTDAPTQIEIIIKAGFIPDTMGDPVARVSGAKPGGPSRP